MEGLTTPPSTPPCPLPLRRSTRLNLLLSNGRDFLTDQLQLASIGSFEMWLSSSIVHSHLYLWHKLCIVGRNHYNTAIAWINEGPQGFFYDPSRLEEDLLLLCLEQGSGSTAEDRFRNQTDDDALAEWRTQDIWARCVWRIVEAGQAPGGLFEKRFTIHPAACYGAVVDVLVVSFHSIAFRGRESWYDRLLKASGPGRHATRMSLPDTPNSLLDLPDEEQTKEQPNDEDDNASTIILAPARKRHMQRRAQVEDWQDDDSSTDPLTQSHVSEARDSDYVDTESVVHDPDAMCSAQLADVDDAESPVQNDAYTRQWVAELGADYRASMSEG